MAADFAERKGEFSICEICGHLRIKICRCHRSTDILADGDGRVVTAEPEGVIQRHPDFALAGFVRDVIQVALGVGFIEIDGRRGNVITNRKDAENSLDRSGSAQQMSGR